jgi:hypothetical protein
VQHPFDDKPPAFSGELLSKVLVELFELEEYHPGV